MPEPLKDITEQPSLTQEPGVVVPGLTAIKPAKAMKQFRPEKSTLAKLNMEEADIGEVDSEEKTAGVIRMFDKEAFMAGYRQKEAGDKMTGAKVPGTGFRLGQKADMATVRKAMNSFRAAKGKKPSAPDVQWAGKKGPSAGSRKQKMEAELAKD